ncbi:MAG: glutamine amidotransferase [Hyphomonadaceae bacterium]|nr:glutamine amidotransferase [Hyphomonadaceae bacterium]
MRVTILETGRAPGRLSEDFPRYADMFVSLLSNADENLSFETVALLDGAALPDPSRREAVVITGSPVGVYDSTPWMDPLRDFVRQAFEARTPMVGICFGHQIIADAMGGDVRKSEKGWGVGRHSYEIIGKRPWMNGAGSSVSLSVSHQDQVITPPKGAVTLARSAHTEHAMLVYDGAPVMSLQGHPEFGDAFVLALYGARRGRSLTDEQVDAAIESLAQPEDNALVGEWMVRFLRSAS